MSESDPLAGLENWLGAVLQGLSPAQRKRAAMKVGQALRKSNLQRIAKNVEPDGAPMEKRKSRLDQTGRVRRKAGGKMFRKLRLARNFKITARADGVEVAPIGGAAKVAKEHHYGLRGFVGRSPNGEKVFTRYPERRLLGFNDTDRETVIDVLAQMIDP